MMSRIHLEPSPHSPPPGPSPKLRTADQLRRSLRLEERKRSSLGVFFANLPVEVLQIMLSYMPARTLSQLAQVSSGWHGFLRDWIQLKSAAWSVAPKRRCRYLSDEYFDEYTELGLLCRRLLPGATLPERAHSCWKVLENMEWACMSRCRPDHNYEPNFIGAANFFRAAVPLSCSRTQGERFEAMWRIARDAVGVVTDILDKPPGKNGRQETDLRLAMRVLFLSPTAPPRHVRRRRSDRGATLHALLCKLTVHQQAKALLIIYGLRTGFTIEWERPCDPGHRSLSQMAHIVGELGTALDDLAKRSSTEFIHNLVCEMTSIPSRWLPRYEVMLYLTMGERAAAAVLAGFALKVYPNEDTLVTTRLSQIICLSELYKSKLESGDIMASRPVLTASSVSVLEILKHLCKMLPENFQPLVLLHQLTTQAFFLSFNVGGGAFATRVMTSFEPVLDYFQRTGH